jgi:NADP-dependent 3-hydroxy acid dehydrogenase YdfG
MANEKVAVVAGVGPGIGARFVETLSQEGYRVVALARKATFLTSLRKTFSRTSTAKRLARSFAPRKQFLTCWHMAEERSPTSAPPVR